MGVLQFQDLTDWQEALQQEECDLLSDPDDATPIGRRGGSPPQHSATWIELDEDSGKLVYGRELEIEVYRGHEKILPQDLQQRLGFKEVRGWLFQIREAGPNPQPLSFARLEGKEILLSKLPYSRNYFVRRKLKPCKQEKSIWAQVGRAWEKHRTIPLTDERLDSILQELPVTPFVSFKGCRAAWAIVAERFDGLKEDRFDTEDDYTIAALDIPFEDAYEIVRSDPAIQQTLDLTDDGILFHKYKGASVVRAAIRCGLRPPKGPIRRSVTEALCANRNALMKAACSFALCGREDPRREDSVVAGAILIYHRLAHQFVGREKNPVVRAARSSNRFETLDSADCSPSVLDILIDTESTVRDYSEEWRELGEEVATVQVGQLVDHILKANAADIDEEFIATLRPVLAGWPSGWKRPQGLETALQRLKMPAAGR